MKRKFLILIIISIFLLTGFLVFEGVKLYNNFIINKNLESLSYNEESIEVIKGSDLDDYIIENAIYSKVLEAALVSDNFYVSLIDTYASVSYAHEYDTAGAINSLHEKGYDKEEIVSIFKTLETDELDTLIETDKIDNILSFLDIYIFDIYKLDRYLGYKGVKSDYALSTVVTYVNIGLDNDFYTNINDISNPDSLFVICNKYNKLPSDYEPSDLEKISSFYSNASRYLKKVAKDAFENMGVDMTSLGMHIEARSAYRSYSYQGNLYNNYVIKDGKEAADTYSARAGHSEHQTGLAVDVGSTNTIYGTFKNTDEYDWIKDNAHLYGFVVRYEEGKEFITGYISEAWHLRYVGKEVATYIYENDITFDEYYVLFVEKK